MSLKNLRMTSAYITRCIGELYSQIIVIMLREYLMQELCGKEDSLHEDWKEKEYIPTMQGPAHSKTEKYLVEY
jgi:hypothetical protein